MKVGDRVRIIKTGYMGKHVQVGQLGVIDSIDYGAGDYALYNLVMDLDPSTDWPFDEDEIEVVTE